MDLERYRLAEAEKARTEDLVLHLPRGRASVLDIGARDGHFSRILTKYFTTVTALDLEKPSFECPGMVAIGGDVTKLEFPDNSFDCVFCVEVLEHISEVQRACSEISRVAKHEIVIGVPFRQDLRVGRTTCRTCLNRNPPWGHVNSFDESKLLSLFPRLEVISKSFVWTNKEATNAISTFLMDRAGNPWGTYEQEEPCICCGARLVSPLMEGNIWQKACAGLAVRINCAQALWLRPHANWIHMIFSKSNRAD